VTYRTLPPASKPAAPVADLPVADLPPAPAADLPPAPAADPTPVSVAGLTPATAQSDPRRRLGEVLIQLGYTDRDLVEQVMARRESSSKLPVGELLVESGIINASQLAHALAERNNLDFVDLNIFVVDQGAANLVSAAEAQRYGSIPIAFLDDGTLLVATSDPSNVFGLDDIAMKTGYEVHRAIATPDGVAAVISQLSSLSDSVQEIHDAAPEETEVVELRESGDQAPVVKLVHAIIADAVDRGASDIHFEPRDGDMHVRFRVDGVASDTTTVPKRMVAGLISRIKIMAELDIAERRIPQDGRVALTVDGRQIDIRVATLPVIRGESAVMRILDKTRVVLDLSTLGMRDEDREALLRCVRRVQGAVLVTGPTGAGKTTTLYALLTEVNTPEKTLISIEDPVEYEVEGVKQIQVNAKAGLTFAAGLRSMVRSDPDTLMVGEIRDRETAQIAIESALTGHLVLSTLHTNDAPIAAPRLTDMGIEPYLIASAIECVVAQRLARRLCDQCKAPATVSAAQLFQNGSEAAAESFEAFEPVGCVSCGGTGYKGRVGIYEVMVVSEEIRSLIIAKAPAGDIARAAVANGMSRMRDDGIEKVRQGLTSIPEVFRILGG
jgi:type IV pilus assembly protein PilB